MLSPTNATISSAGQARLRLAVRDGLEARVLVARAGVGLAQDHVERQLVRPEDGLGVRALADGAVGDDREAPAQLAHAREEGLGARLRQRLAALRPRVPARPVEGQPGALALELVERVVDHGLVGVEHDAPAAARAALGLACSTWRSPRRRPAGRSRGARPSRATSGSRSRGAPPEGPGVGGRGCGAGAAAGGAEGAALRQAASAPTSGEARPER